MNYVGIDWAYGRAAFCALSETGAIESEGLIPADHDGLAGLVLSHGTEVKACVEMMSGAVWVRDELEAAGWERVLRRDGPPLVSRVAQLAPAASSSA